jgi:hypothetical protein
MSAPTKWVEQADAVAKILAGLTHAAAINPQLDMRETLRKHALMVLAILDGEVPEKRRLH